MKNAYLFLFLASSFVCGVAHADPTGGEEALSKLLLRQVIQQGLLKRAPNGEGKPASMREVAGATKLISRFLNQDGYTALGSVDCSPALGSESCELKLTYSRGGSGNSYSESLLLDVDFYHDGSRLYVQTLEFSGR